MFVFCSDCEGYERLLNDPLTHSVRQVANNGSNYFRNLDRKPVRVAFLLVVDWLKITSFLM